MSQIELDDKTMSNPAGTTRPKRRQMRGGRLRKVDGRSAEAKLMQRVRKELTAQLGGKPDASARMMIDRAAVLSGYLARLDVEALSPQGMSDHRRREYLAADSSLRRMLLAITNSEEAAAPPDGFEKMDKLWQAAKGDKK